MATLPSESQKMDTMLVRDTLALLILKELPSPDNKDEFNTIFGRVDFLISFSSKQERTMVRSRVLHSFFYICTELNLETWASTNQMETLRRGYSRPPRRDGSWPKVGRDVEEWMAWLLIDLDDQEGE